jgi:hypothetical protein
MYKQGNVYERLTQCLDKPDDRYTNLRSLCSRKKDSLPVLNIIHNDSVKERRVLLRCVQSM